MTAPSSPAADYSGRYRALVLGLLLCAYVVNFIDRSVLSILGPAIRADLGLSSTQIGLLGGLYFALLYTLLGLPIARLAERMNRVNILALSLAVWSGFTALCGLASNFVGLALCRFGVGVGEAGCSPPAHSLISDYFPPSRRASAMAVYSLGVPLGVMFGAAAGGWLAQSLGWRWAFVAVGLPGVLLAIAIRLLMREPPRGHADAQARLAAGLAPEPQPAPPPLSLGRELREIGAVARTLFGRWSLLHMTLGITLVSFGLYGSNQFAPQYFVAAFQLDLATVGLIVGLIGGVGAGVGTLAGGFLADRLARRSPAWYALTPAIGLALCTPLYILAYTQPSWTVAAAILIVPGLFHYTYLGPTFGVVQNAVPVRRRATATAVLLLFLNMIALAGGPPFTGWVIDRLAEARLAGVGVGDVWALLGVWLGGAAPTADFAVVCPGGVAPTGAGAGQVEACRAALAEGTRGGLVLTFLFYAWASVHYFLAAMGMSRRDAPEAGEE
ncbi:MAG: MFS transporter [Brevundimonas sp.]|uniref:spinster family MFS transporter n=1 Tax=Brevundimonas sp. TaxID=1871086 RepID=UPI0025BA58DB|nr:MFS transporter [Brevundimonas sp.]MBX3477735.1 MFS transporter [Brevundimonas sp.]